MFDFFYQCFPHLKGNSSFQTRLAASEALLPGEKELVRSIALTDPAAKGGGKLQLEREAVLRFTWEGAGESLPQSIELLKPWRKGPFQINGIEIDGEWRCDIKWKHFIDKVNIKGKRVLDIGANNGYYMFRTLLENPIWVLGVDPTFRYWAQYFFFRQMLSDERLMYCRLGHQDLTFFPKQFDLVLCLGVIYHTIDPISLLRNIGHSLARGGELILESQGIPGEDPLALIPQGKYVGARGMWYLPTASALKHWLIRSGFNQVEVFHTHTLETTEQRPTQWSPGESLAQGLDPQDPTKTIEGYPAPIRIYLKAGK